MNSNNKRFNKLLLELIKNNKIKNNKIFIEDIYEIINDDNKELFFKYLSNEGYIIDYNEKIDNFDYNEDSLSFYLKEISNFEVFSNEEEKYYFELYKKNPSEELKNFIAEHNLKLVVALAKCYTNTSIEFLDLIQAGNIGLLRSIDKFDIDKGYKFSSYASTWILKEIRNTIAIDSRTIKLPHWVNEKMTKIVSERRKFIIKKGYEPTILELSKLTGYKEEEIKEILSSEKQIISLNSYVSSNCEDTDATLEELIPDTNNISVEEEVINNLYIKKFWELAKESLTENEYKVLMLRYDKEFNVMKTCEKIGAELNVTKQRIGKIEKDAKRKCRRKLNYYI